MRLSKPFILLGLLLSIVLCSCKKTQPQLPANKIVENNEDAQTLLEINKKLALREDSLLKIVVNKKDKSFVKSELGFWYKITNKTNGSLPKNNEQCEINYALKLLSGRVVLKESKKIVIGKKDIVPGIEEGVKLLKKGERATLIIPWYLGYGMTGLDELIPPYTSLICEVELKE